MHNTHAVRYRRVVREIVLAAAFAATVFTPVMLVARPQAPPQVPQGGGDFVAALKAAPGVLGVEAARTQGGKQALFVWFENKQAVLAWYYSDAHQQLMHSFAPGVSSGREPLANVPDGTGPILVIASLTYADEPQVAGVQMPVSQISVELYAPLPGGLAAGGRFAPSGVKVPGLLEAPAPPR